MSNKTYFEIISKVNEGYKPNKGLKYRELCAIAKDKKIKYYGRYSKNELERMLGLEISKPNEKHEKIKEKMNNPIKVIAINKATYEILRFKSLYCTGKNFNMNPESIKWIIKKKKDLKFNDESFLIFYDC